MSGKTGSELSSVIESNDCLYTPFWKSSQAVVNLKEQAFKDNFAANRYVITQNKKYLLLLNYVKILNNYLNHLFEH